MIDFSLIIGGEAGFGIMTTGLMFSQVACRLGYYILDYIEYPSLVRGGHNAYLIRVSEEKINAFKNTVDILVCLNKETFLIHKNKLTPESFIIYDNEEFQVNDKYKKVPLPLRRIVDQLEGNVVMRNTVALGAILALLGSDLIILNELIEKKFKKKGKEVIDFNKNFALAGFNYIKNNHSSLIKSLLINKKTEEKLVLSGNEAFSLAAAIADCRLYCAYPMTPSSSVLHTLASWQKKTGMVVRHAEDEISVINTALGASFAGVRSAIGTSGGGFALMVESVSLAGITETPIVIFIAQRPGPATGMPTWTEQGDLLFACFSGHGEFPKIVLAPGDQQEMIELTLKAFNLADIYQLPVIILSDMYLSEGHRSLSKNCLKNIIKNYEINRGKLINLDSIPKLHNFLRYKFTEDGISERLIIGNSDFFYQANSYEHLEDGHTTEDSQIRKMQVDKRNKKWKTYLKNDFQLPNFYGDKQATIIFISWGSTKGVVLSAQKELFKKNIITGFYHFNHLYPLDKKKLINLFTGNKRYILVENNSWGQLGKLLSMETGIILEEKILRYDGRAITEEEIVNYVLNIN